MWGCAAVVLMLVLAVSGAVLWRWLVPPRSDNLTLGKPRALLSETIGASGGTLVVQQPDSAVNGMSIAVPANAYPEDKTFNISARPIEGHKLGPDFTPLTPLIRIDNGHAFADEQMTVEIPIRLAEGQFAMAFYYDERTGQLEGLPVVDLRADRITVIAQHFSDVVVSAISLSSLLDTDVDTGFAPGVDDWQFVNDGSTIAQGGHCAGQAFSMMWYYYERRLGAGDRPLYGRWDNNDYGFGTIDYQWDDSWGYRMASVVQRIHRWNDGRKALAGLGAASDTLTWYSFAYAMRITGEPQYVSIGRHVPTNDGKQARRGHALVAYRIEKGQLWIADPNYPSKADRAIQFENGAFLPYASGARATDIAANGVSIYPEIRYMAKSALVNYDAIGQEYERLLEGKVGEGHFPAHLISYVADVNPTTGDIVWKDLPEVLELDEEATAKPGQGYRGKLQVGIGMNQRFQASLVEGTTVIQTVLSDASHRVTFVIPMTPGVRDLGFRIDNVIDNALYYTDLQRVKVLYERPDLSGTWEGTWRVSEVVNARRYVEDVLTRIILWTGLAKTEQEAREAAAAGIQESPTLYDDRPMTVMLEAIDPDVGDRYRMQVYMLDDDTGETTSYDGEAAFRDGVLTFEVKSPDGSTMAFTGTMTGNDDVSGTFSGTAWVVVKNALSGSWTLTRKAP